MALNPATSTPSLVALSYALRHPETWPEGFVWDYRDCAQCAMGLAYRLWQDLLYAPCENAVCSAMNIPENAASADIFFGVHCQLGLTSMGDVLPTHVADAIDAHLAAQVTP